MVNLRLLALLAFLLSMVPAHAQKGEGGGEEGENEEMEFHPHHSLGLVVSHVNLREVVEGGEKSWLSVPGWGLDYNYIFHLRWAVGLHTDFVFEEFLVEKRLEGGEEGEIIERSFPVAPALIATWKPAEHWGLMFGPGVEFASGETLFLNRFGIEFSAEIGEKGWEFLAVVQYDVRYSTYDSYMLGMGVAKLFGE